MSLVECAVLGVLSSFAIILNEEERWVLYFNCLPGVLLLFVFCGSFLTVAWVGLQ